MTYNCERCQWTWKTEKWFQNHKCYLRCQFCFWKWKTDKWYNNHLCHESPEYKQKQIDSKNKALEREQYLQSWYQDLIKLAIEKDLFIYKIGDVVYWAYEIITKPTHEWSEYRQRYVHKRYEAEKVFRVKKFEITEIKPYVSMYESSLKELEDKILSWNSISWSYNWVRESDIYLNEREAEERCSNMSKSYSEYLDECSRCR